jgi:mono/diheme cytochrome c family protein
MRAVRTLATILLTALALAAVGCGGGENTSANQSTEPDVTTGTATGATTSDGGGEGDAQAGSIIWVTEACSNCHAIDGMPATSLDGPNFDQEKPDHDTIVEVVTNGKGSMQGFGDTLSPEDIENVAAYVEQSARGS